ncbi:MAG: flagellar biosynthesis protein FlhF [Desulfobulbaceae bacterium]|nr:flagellar biosynthesis protein FlhF [Desulfobulbaceae bacterium]
MQVKVFAARDMASGLKKVKETLGPDALILSTKTVRNGKLGVIGKPTLEITAAIDTAWNDQTREAAKHERRLFMSGDGQESSGKPKLSEMRNQLNTESSSNSEIGELRNMIQGLSRRLSGMEQPASARPYVEPEYSRHDNASTPDPVIQLLCRQGINLETARVVARFTRDTIENNEFISTSDLNSILTKTIAKLFNVRDIIPSRLTDQKRISLIGPTGVGKTTTIAKLAANYLDKFNGRIGLITIDTYRIAAVEQLKVYGEIMNLPVEVVIKPEDLDRALSKHSNCDLILIDTAGRSPRNDIDIQELADFFRPHLGIENHLLLSATTREEELESIIHRFGYYLPMESFIFSKIDECGLLGILLNMHYKNDTPISLLTNGQRVPEDLLYPDPVTIAGLIMNGNGALGHG